MKATKLTCAADIMQRDLIVARPSDNLRCALDLMTENHVTASLADERRPAAGAFTAG